MTPIFQTVIDKGRGNCQQAALASLFDLPLEAVPNFILCDDWFKARWDVLKSIGRTFDYNIYNPRDLGNWGEERKLPEELAIKGCFYAVVNSPMYFDAVEYCEKGYCTTHAVLIDKDFNIVHDPNPNNAGLKQYPMSRSLGWNGVLRVEIYNTLHT